MTARVVALTSPEAAEGRTGGTTDDRLAAVEALTREAWRLSGRDLPSYTRGAMPVAITVWHALASFGAPLESLTIQEEDFTVADRVVQLGLPPYRIDILTSITGVGFHEAWDDRLDGTLYGIPVPFLGRDAFIRNKRASGRVKDLEDIRLMGG